MQRNPTNSDKKKALIFRREGKSCGPRFHLFSSTELADLAERTKRDAEELTAKLRNAGPLQYDEEQGVYYYTVSNSANHDVTPNEDPSQENISKKM